MSKIVVSSDVIIRPGKETGWIVTQLRMHRHITLDPKGVETLMRFSQGASEDLWISELKEASGRDCSRFTNADGLMTNPTGFVPAQGEPISGEKLFHLLRNNWFLHLESGEDYRQYLAPKTSVLDNQHLGTFHQAVGQYHVVHLRLKEKWRWWHDQKFESDGKALRSGYYRWIQGHFFKNYFSNQDLKGKRLFDFGCGNGFYSRQFADWGAYVTGIDTSSELIEMAKRNHPGLEFILPKNESECLEIVANLPAASFDYIYLSDVLLFFFHDLKTHQKLNEDLLRLLKGFRKALKPSGRLYLMEPNGTFWLSSWLGEAPRPWAPITEYRNRLYHVAPTADTVITTLGATGFLVKEYRHPEIQEWEEGMDRQAYAFAKSFPIWDFYVCVPDHSENRA